MADDGNWDSLMEKAPGAAEGMRVIEEEIETVTTTKTKTRRRITEPEGWTAE